jgi:adenosylcobinamide-phosphate synthase
MIPPPPAIPLALALLCDAVVGDPPWLYRRVPHPVAIMGRGIAALNRAWNRPEWSTNRRLVAGGCATLIVVCASGAAGMVVERLLGFLPYGWIAEAVLMSVLIAQKSLYLHVREVAGALSRGGLSAGRQAVAKIVGRDTATLDEAGVARGALESLAENFSDGVVAPAFWALLFGLPGILAYKALNTADSMIGHRSGNYLHFGRLAARLDDIANFIPARLAGAILCLAAWTTPGNSAGRGFRLMLTDAGKHRSVNAGYPEAAMAGALGVRLSGPRRYDGETVDEPWIGAGLADADASEITRGLTLFVRACAVHVCLIAIVAVTLIVPV